MIDHTGINVGDFEASRRFYATALAPLGYELLIEFHSSVAGFGEQGKPDFWIVQGEANTPRIHVAFRADTRQKVDAFYETALGAGGRDNGTPGLRPHTTLTIMEPSSWIRTVTTSKLCANRRRDRTHRTAGSALRGDGPAGGRLLGGAG